MNLLRGLWCYGNKVFALSQRLAAVGNYRCQPEIPTRSLTCSLFLGALLRVESSSGLAALDRLVPAHQR